MSNEFVKLKDLLARLRESPKLFNSIHHVIKVYAVDHKGNMISKPMILDTAEESKILMESAVHSMMVRSYRRLLNKSRTLDANLKMLRVGDSSAVDVDIPCLMESDSYMKDVCRHSYVWDDLFTQDGVGQVDLEIERLTNKVPGDTIVLTEVSIFVERYPEEYIKSFVYRNGILTPDFYNCLMEYGNTVLSRQKYDKAMHLLSEQYHTRAHQALEKLISMATGLGLIQIEEKFLYNDGRVAGGTSGEPDRYYIVCQKR